MKVLVVGSGGREHALCWAIAKSPKCTKLFAAPGNPGMEQMAECIDLCAEDIAGIIKFAKESEIDFVVIGPEAPLVAGLVDGLAEAGIKSFGPRAKAAVLEGSKGFMKDLCTRYSIPTANYRKFNEPDAAKSFIRRHEFPLVVKADGLAAGKGVIICRNIKEAHAAIDDIMTNHAFGKEAGAEVVIEDFLVGEEASFFALVDGENALPMVSAQDHKPAFDGDVGPNTGGMGAYTPAPLVDNNMVKQIMNDIIYPTVTGMVKEGRPYKGVLYAGLMITKEGPKLIEYNVRFGDPECQPLMMRLKSDVLEALVACAEGRLNEIKLCWYEHVALIVIMAAEGYPGQYKKGNIINGVEKAKAIKGVEVFHSGTSLDNGKLISNGGRVLGVAVIAPSVEEARKNVYKAINCIDWPGGFYRQDIGWRAIDK